MYPSKLNGRVHFDLYLPTRLDLPMSMLGTTHTTMLFYATASTFSSNSRTVLPSIKNGNSRHYGKVLEASLCIIVKVIVLLL